MFKTTFFSPLAPISRALFFFFQAEDGIRDKLVTGVQRVLFRSAELGVLLQGNFQCFGDPPHAHTRRTAERFLTEGRYFTLGTDLHGVASLPLRWSGFDRVREDRKSVV